MKNRVVGIILVLSMLAMFAVGCGAEDDAEEEVQEEEYVPVEVNEVKYKTLVRATSMSGKIFANKNVMIMPTMPGKVETVSVKDGDYVNKGELLFTLDKKDIQNQIEQAKSAYDLAKANHSMSMEQKNMSEENYQRTKQLTESVLEDARKNLENTEKLYEAGAVAKTQLDQAELNLEQQESQMKSQLDQAEQGASNNVTELANAQLKQAEVAYNQAKDALSDAVITSPTSGVVTDVAIEEGGMATNSQPSLKVVDVNNLYVNIEVVEGLINELSEGQEVDITIPAVASGNVNAVIDTINPVPDERTQLYSVKIYIGNKGNTIKPGMFANVEIPLDVKGDILSVPSDTVITEGERNLVYIVEDSRAVEREVEIGLDTGVEIEIVQGLNENDKVITKGHNYVKDNEKVKVLGGAE